MSVTIPYPTPGANVPGGGGFFVWGTTTDDSVTGASANWQAPDAAPATAVGVPVFAPAPCSWAYVFSNVGVGPDITLTITAANSGPWVVTFKCAGHAK